MKRNKVLIPTYNYGHDRLPTHVDPESMTKQSFTAECDVNQIIRRYDRTGLVTHLQKAQAVYADVSHVTSYQEAIQTVQDAQSAFYDLPSGLRAHFGNDAARYLDWATTATDAERADMYAQMTGADRHSDPAPESTPTQVEAASD